MVGGAGAPLLLKFTALIGQNRGDENILKDGI